MHSAAKLRELHVAPNGKGTGSSSNPMSLSAAIAGAKAGDLYWLAEGTYTGVFKITRPGTAANPIVFRAQPGAHAKINGVIRITGDHNWIWGLEVTDPGNLGRGLSGIEVQAGGVHVINNLIHDVVGGNGIGAWAYGPGQVIYGNIAYRNGSSAPYPPHNIYTQNNYAAHGYKYFVNNLLLNSQVVRGKLSFNYHAYTENGTITGMNLQNNVFSNGRFLIGGYGIPADNGVVNGNYFYNSYPQFGYSKPSQVEFRRNYVGRGGIRAQFFWSGGDTFTKTAPNVFTDNEVHLPLDGYHISFRSATYAGGKVVYGGRLQSGDLIDGNRYSAPFKAWVTLGGVSADNANLAKWRQMTASAGRAFDVNASEVPVPSGAKIAVLPNEYERGRGHVVVYNWSRKGSVTVDLSSVVANGSSFSVYDAEDILAAPLFTGTYAGPVSIATGDREFLALLVRSESKGDTVPPSITNVNSGSITSSSATIGWTTNESAYGQVEYGKTSAYGIRSPMTAAPATQFAAKLTNLESNTIYYYRGRARDAAGNESVSPGYHFTTGSVAPAPPPPSPAPKPSPNPGPGPSPGAVLLADSFDQENGSKGKLNYATLTNWDVLRGTTDLIGNGYADYFPGRGLYLDLDGSSNAAAKLSSKKVFALSAGVYELAFDIAGSRSGSDTVVVSLGGEFSEQITLAAKTPFQTVTRRISIRGATAAKLVFDHAGGDNMGLLIDNVRLTKLN